MLSVECRDIKFDQPGSKTQNSTRDTRNRKMVVYATLSTKDNYWPCHLQKLVEFAIMVIIFAAAYVYSRT